MQDGYTMNDPRAAQPTDILHAIPAPPSAGAGFDVERILLARARQQADDESLGARVARLRREKGLTQEELADLLEVTQPVVSDYERGRLRLHGELIVALTEILGVSADDLLGLQTSKPRNGAIKNRRLLRQVQALEKLPKRDQQAVIRTIEAFLAKAG